MAREDKAEQRRLWTAAPKHVRSVSDLSGWTFAVTILFDDYEVRQFELLAHHLFAKSHFLLTEAETDTTGETADELDLFQFMHDVSVYRFVVNETAWAMVRDELRIDPDALRIDDWLFDLATEQMPLHAPSADQFLERHAARIQQFEHDHGTPFNLIEAADVADTWRQMFRELGGQ